VRLRELENEIGQVIEARARRKSTEILAEAQAEQIKVLQGARNEILKRKLEILKAAGDTGALLMFISQLPELVRIYEAGAKYTKVDKLLVMNKNDSYGSTVNRGPDAFNRFLGELESMTGLSLARLAERAAAESRT